MWARGNSTAALKFGQGRLRSIAVPMFVSSAGRPSRPGARHSFAIVVGAFGSILDSGVIDGHTVAVAGIAYFGGLCSMCLRASFLQPVFQQLADRR